MMHTDQNATEYLRFRRAGYTPYYAQKAVQTVGRFQYEEAKGLVRLRAEPEEESYFDVYGEPEGYTSGGKRVSPAQERQEIIEAIERAGCWYVCAEWRLTEEDEWEHADGVGMCIGENPLSPLENQYIPDMMNAALDALTAARLQLELATVE